MSHIVSIKTQVRSFEGLRAACNRLALAVPEMGTAQLFTTMASGAVVRLPQWRYPVVFDLTGGDVQFDNYGGKWGHQEQLDKLLQAYAVETTKLEARRKGYSVTEQSLSDGSVKLVVQVGGAA